MFYVLGVVDCLFFKLKTDYEMRISDGISDVGSSELQAAQHAIFLGTGSDIISGSTRMKAGTAQKAAINIISTTIMLRLGKVYRGQMVDMVVSNAKLQRRAAGIVQMLTK